MDIEILQKKEGQEDFSTVVIGTVDLKVRDGVNFGIGFGMGMFFWGVILLGMIFLGIIGLVAILPSSFKLF